MTHRYDSEVPATPPVTPPVTPPTSAHVQEHRRVRVVLLVWASMVAITGLLMIGLSFIRGVEFPVIFAGLVAMMGVFFIIGAAISAIVGRTRPTGKDH